MKMLNGIIYWTNSKKLVETLDSIAPRGGHFGICANSPFINSDGKFAGPNPRPLLICRYKARFSSHEKMVPQDQPKPVEICKWPLRCPYENKILPLLIRKPVISKPTSGVEPLTYALRMLWLTIYYDLASPMTLFYLTYLMGLNPTNYT